MQSNIRAGANISVFQSAPLAEARGDCTATAAGASSDRTFQSAPLAEARGDAQLLQLFQVCVLVSIRSPCRSKGRSICVTSITFNGARFNLLPLPKQRGDLQGARRQDHRDRRFNPLPLPKQGEIRRRGRGRAEREVSIRSPCRSKGRSPPSAFTSIFSTVFQSAPLAEARGESCG